MGSLANASDRRYLVSSCVNALHFSLLHILAHESFLLTSIELIPYEALNLAVVRTCAGRRFRLLGPFPLSDPSSLEALQPVCVLPYSVFSCCVLLVEDYVVLIYGIRVGVVRQVSTYLTFKKSRLHMAHRGALRARLRSRAIARDANNVALNGYFFTTLAWPGLMAMKFLTALDSGACRLCMTVVAVGVPWMPPKAGAVAAGPITHPLNRKPG